MKVAKSYKFIVLIVAFLLSMACALGFMNVSTARAESVEDPKNYFDINGATASFTQSGLEVLVKDGTKVSFKNDLVVNELSLRMKLPEDFKTSFILDLDSYYVNGNPKEWSKYGNEGTTFETSIKNIIELSYLSNDAFSCSINGQQIQLDNEEGYVTLDLSVINNYLTVGTFNIENEYDADQKNYYKLKNIDDKIVVKKLTFDFYTTEDNATDSFVMEWVNQKRGDNNYKQLLTLEDGQTKLTSAYPRVCINEDFYIRTSDGSYSAIKKAYTQDKYKLTIKSCSVLGGYSNLYLIGSLYDDVLLESNTLSPNEFRFKTAGDNIKFGIGEVKEDDNQVKTAYVYEEFNVDTVNSLATKDAEKPVYGYFENQLDNDIAYAGFLNGIKKASTVEKEGGTTTSVGLGTEFKLPSMKDLVSDNFVVYEELTSKIYYRTVSSSQTSLSDGFTLNYIGNYIFFVTFSDGENGIEESDFFIEEDDGTVSKGTYFDNYVFEFEIVDNADIEVKAPEIQGNGYKGIKHKASEFIVDAKGCIMQYKLYYNPDVNANADDGGWVEIPKADELTNEKYNNGGFNYSAVKKVAYDGELTFVPTKIGAYKIVCTATSSVSSREASDETIVKVASAPKVVEVPSKWLENNLWSVVFLSVGTLCLIGIIALLFVKPKDETEK